MVVNTASLLKLAMQAVKLVGFGVAVGVPVAVTGFELIGGPATVTGSSMQPNFNPPSSGRVADVVWVNRLPVASGRLKPMPGHVVVIRSPSDPENAMIKRVVARGGEYVCTRNYKVRQLTVPEGHLWVEGDNRRTSRDSNLFGPVSEGLVQGVVSHIVWPPSRWQKVQHKLTGEQLERTKKQSTVYTDSVSHD